MDKATEYKNLGNQAFKDQKFEQAVEYFTKAIELNPNDHVFYSNRSGAYASLQDYEKALQDATKCVELKPDWAKGYQRKGLAEFYLEKYDDSTKTYQEGLKLEPTNQQLKEGLQRAEEEKEQQDLLGGIGGIGSEFDGQIPQGVDNKFLTGLIAKLQQNPKTKEYLKDKGFVQKLQMLGKNPMLFTTLGQQDPRIQEALQVMLGDLGNFQKPGGENQQEEEIPTTSSQNKQEYQASPQQNTQKQEKQSQEPQEESERRKAEGNEYYKKKEFQKALELYQQAIDLKPTELLYYNNKAACYIEMGELENAQKELELALKIKEDNNIYDFEKLSKIYARFGSLYTKKDELATAIEWYKKSLVENNNKNVAEELRRIEKLKKTKDEQNYINPTLAEEANERGKEFFKQGNFPAAVKEYTEAIKRSPVGAKYYFNRGLSYQKLMEAPSAIQDYQKCLELDSNYNKAYAKKADCHFMIKEYHKALDYYEKGLKIDANSVECQQGIQKTQAAIYSGTGSQEEQEQRARKAMSDPEIQEILRTPEVSNALKAMQSDPKEAMKILQNPTLGPKIQKLIEAGILKIGN